MKRFLGYGDAVAKKLGECFPEHQLSLTVASAIWSAWDVKKEAVFFATAAYLKESYALHAAMAAVPPSDGGPGEGAKAGEAAVADNIVRALGRVESEWEILSKKDPPCNSLTSTGEQPHTIASLVDGAKAYVEDMCKEHVETAKDAVQTLLDQSTPWVHGGTKSEHWHHKLQPNAKQATVGTKAAATLLKRPSSDYADLATRIQEATASYEKACKRFGKTVDSALTGRADAMRMVARITEVEWLIAALYTSKRETEEKRRKTHNIKKKLCDCKTVEGAPVFEKLVFKQIRGMAEDMLASISTS